MKLDCGLVSSNLWTLEKGTVIRVVGKIHLEKHTLSGLNEIFWHSGCHQHINDVSSFAKEMRAESNVLYSVLFAHFLIIPVMLLYSVTLLNRVSMDGSTSLI